MFKRRLNEILQGYYKIIWKRDIKIGFSSFIFFISLFMSCKHWSKVERKTRNCKCRAFLFFVLTGVVIHILGNYSIEITFLH